MILPFLLHSPPQPSLSRSSSPQWPQDTLFLAQSSLVYSSSLRFSAAFLSAPHPMTLAVRCSPDMAHSNKRLCKTLEICNCGSRDCLHAFAPTFRVSAFTRHGRPGPSAAELEQTDDDDDDGSKSKLKASRKVKSAEELHFEAIESYSLRYENEDNYCSNGDGSIVGFEADDAPLKDMKATPVADDVNTSTNESKYLDASGMFPWIANGSSSSSQLNRCKEKEDSLPQENMSFKFEELQMPSRESQSMRTVDVIDIDRPKNIYAIPGNFEMKEVSQNEGSVPKLMRNETVRACNLDDFQYRSKLDEETVPTQSCQFQNKELKSNMESTSFDEIGDLSEEQKIRMELNKAAALARRHMRSCKDAVREAQVKGLPFPKFESLLVEKSWVEALKSEFQKPYMERLYQFVSQEAAGKIPIYPPPAKLFNAFNSCPLDKVKVVIIGQDPYHGPGQAMGLCFSVEKGIKLPSSLTNIFLEIQSDLDCDFPSHGNLEKWAHQGVLLLNTVLTVRDRHANSHAKKGWELFTDAAIRTLVQQRSGVVFLLWGNQAQEKLRLINRTSHHILKAYHPSGISAHRGFFKCRHFSEANRLLVDQGLLPIDWQL